MKYRNLVHGLLERKVNRFIAEVFVHGVKEQVHIKNTGRLTELLQPGAEVLLEPGDQPGRKTRFSLVAAAKSGEWVNIDSQAPNKLAYEAIAAGRLKEFGAVSALKREVTFGGSRFDLYVEADGQAGFIEVKGVTLEKDGMALFPDAPTARGTKHVLEMIQAVQAGYLGAILFVVQMKGCRGLAPYREMDPAFSEALEQAALKGVQILAYDSYMEGEHFIFGRPVPVQLYPLSSA